MKILLFWKPLVWWLIILMLSLMPAGHLSGPEIIPHFDKLAHFGMYMILAVLLWRPWNEKRWLAPTVLIVMTTTLLGIAVEFMQHYLTADRYGSIGDVLANTSGSFTGLLIWMRLPLENRWLRWI